MAREINLVPDIKGEMIKALKLRNFIFFLCIIVASASIAASLITWGIATGQQAVADGKKNTLTTLSNKINDYSGLSNFLTIKDQLGNLSSISSNKKLLSRTFGILSALLPKGADTITISQIQIDLSTTEPTITFDAQANAGEEPFFDFRVLDSFQKSMQYMRYDYGNYVDKEGNTIPAYCMIETGADGATFSDPEKGYYAYWLINGDGCNPANSSKELPSSDTTEETDEETTTDADDTKEFTNTSGYATESYDGQTVVRIWRTPQSNLWYGKNQMTLDGQITGVEHFASQCITYTGVKNAASNEVTWSSTNDICYLVPAGSNGINVSGASNGRDSSEELVLRFSATITLNPEVYSFSNNHVLALGPTTRYNVTDSFVQIQNMFMQRAADCAEGDTACASAENKGEN